MVYWQALRWSSRDNVIYVLREMPVGIEQSDWKVSITTNFLDWFFTVKMVTYVIYSFEAEQSSDGIYSFHVLCKYIHH